MLLRIPKYNQLVHFESEEKNENVVVWVHLPHSSGLDQGSLRLAAVRLWPTWTVPITVASIYVGGVQLSGDLQRWAREGGVRLRLAGLVSDSQRDSKHVSVFCFSVSSLSPISPQFGKSCC